MKKEKDYSILLEAIPVVFAVLAFIGFIALGFTSCSEEPQYYECSEESCYKDSSESEETYSITFVEYHGVDSDTITMTGTRSIRYGYRRGNFFVKQGYYLAEKCLYSTNCPVQVLY